MIKNALFTVGVFFCGTLLTFTTAASAQTTECSSETAAFTSDVFSSVSARCCAKNRPKRCLKAAKRSFKRIDDAIGTVVYEEISAAIGTLQTNGCDASAVTVPECTDATATTTDEATTNIEGASCDLRYKDKRQSRLKKFRRNLNKAKKDLNVEFVNAVRENAGTLRKSESCGQGGEGRLGGCSSVVNPRDGADGNVYKQADHSCIGVFVTHDGTRSGSIVSTSGQSLGRLNYTGLGNRDPRGLRHHYRTNQCCSSLPGRFYLKLGSRCYEIDKRCGRVD